MNKLFMFGFVMFLPIIISACTCNSLILSTSLGTTYGEMWNKTSGGYTFPIPTFGIYYNVTGFIPGELKNFAFNDTGPITYLTALKSGTYEIDWSLSFSGGNNNLYGLAIAKNFDNTIMRDCYAQRTTSSFAIGSVGSGCIVYLDVGDNISFQVEDEMNPTSNIKIHTFNLNIIKISGSDDGVNIDNSISKSGDIIDSNSLFDYQNSNLTGINRLESKSIVSTIVITNSTEFGKNAGSGSFGQVAIGEEAGMNNSIIYQVALGHKAGTNTAFTIVQIAIGSEAGMGNSGSYQTVLGSNAGEYNTGVVQTAINAGAGRGNTGDYQTAISSLAGQYNNGEVQTAIGYYAGQYNNGSFQLALGYNAGGYNIGNNTILLGYDAGKDNKLNNQFIVKQGNVNSIPLIQGDFSTGYVGIGNASAGEKLDVAGNVRADSYIEYSTKYEGDAITDIKSISSELGSCKGSICNVDHNTLPEFLQHTSYVKVPDYYIEKTRKEYRCNVSDNHLLINPSGENCYYVDVVYNETIYKIEEQIGRNLGNNVQLNQRAVEQLIERIETLESELCKKDNTYSWCKAK